MHNIFSVFFKNNSKVFFHFLFSLDQVMFLTSDGRATYFGKPSLAAAHFSRAVSSQKSIPLSAQSSPRGPVGLSQIVRIHTGQDISAASTSQSNPPPTGLDHSNPCELIMDACSDLSPGKRRALEIAYLDSPLYEDLSRRVHEVFSAPLTQNSASTRAAVFITPVSSVGLFFPMFFF